MFVESAGLAAAADRKSDPDPDADASGENERSGREAPLDEELDRQHHHEGGEGGEKPPYPPTTQHLARIAQRRDGLILRARPFPSHKLIEILPSASRLKTRASTERIWLRRRSDPRPP